MDSMSSLCYMNEPQSQCPSPDVDILQILVSDYDNKVATAVFLLLALVTGGYIFREKWKHVSQQNRLGILKNVRTAELARW